MLFFGCSEDAPASVRAGRYAEWKYLMTDDCVLKAKNEAKKMESKLV
jgi:hypothetical protein